MRKGCSLRHRLGGGLDGVGCRELGREVRGLTGRVAGRSRLAAGGGGRAVSTGRLSSGRGLARETVGDAGQTQKGDGYDLDGGEHLDGVG